MTGDFSILNTPKFQAPKGWFEGQFQVASDRVIRYGQLIPDDMPRESLIIIPGNQESYEKYFEFIHDLRPYENGTRVFIYDPYGQGESGRDLEDPRKMHSVGFGRDIADLNAFVDHIVLTQQANDRPLIMIGHSKGAHFLMRYLGYNDHPVNKAVFVVPMLGIRSGIIPEWIVKFLTATLYHFGGGERYVPGASHWREDQQSARMRARLSSDPVRSMVRQLWAAKRPQQQMSAVTVGWLYHALQSIAYLNQSAVLKNITIPSLMVTAGGDTVVSINRQNRAAQLIPHCRQITIPKARHDIWMEQDLYREPFIKAIRDFIF